MGKQGTVREGSLVRKRDFKVDFVKFFANIIDGSPSEIA